MHRTQTLTSYPLVSLERFCCPECGGAVRWYVTRKWLIAMFLLQTGGMECVQCEWYDQLDIQMRRDRVLA